MSCIGQFFLCDQCYLHSTSSVCVFASNQQPYFQDFEMYLSNFSDIPILTVCIDEICVCFYRWSRQNVQTIYALYHLKSYTWSLNFIWATYKPYCDTWWYHTVKSTIQTKYAKQEQIKHGTLIKLEAGSGTMEEWAFRRNRKIGGKKTVSL